MILSKSSPPVTCDDTMYTLLLDSSTLRSSRYAHVAARQTHRHLNEVDDVGMGHAAHNGDLVLQLAYLKVKQALLANDLDGNLP